MLWLAKWALKREGSRMNEQVPVLRRVKTQAEAGPLMLMTVRHADMALSLAGSRRIAKPQKQFDR